MIIRQWHRGQREHAAAGSRFGTANRLTGASVPAGQSPVGAAADQRWPPVSQVHGDDGAQRSGPNHDRGPRECAGLVPPGQDAVVASAHHIRRTGYRLRNGQRPHRPTHGWKRWRGLPTRLGVEAPHGAIIPAGEQCGLTVDLRDRDHGPHRAFEVAERFADRLPGRQVPAVDLSVVLASEQQSPRFRYAQRRHGPYTALGQEGPARPHRTVLVPFPQLRTETGRGDEADTRTGQHDRDDRPHDGLVACPCVAKQFATHRVPPGDGALRVASRDDHLAGWRHSGGDCPDRSP